MTRGIGMAILTVLSFCLPWTAVAAVIHVPGEYPTIQAGIDATAHGDTVLVADGTYTGDGNRDLSFGGKRITVRSEKGPEYCVIDCEGTEVEPHLAFQFDSYETPDAVLEGFTITNAYQMAMTSAAINIFQSSSPTICGNIIINNTNGGDGPGGIVVGGGCSPSISNNIITQNHGSAAGAILCAGPGAYPTITGNIITGNTASFGPGISMFVSDPPFPVITHNLISGNVAGGFGGAIICAGASATITNNAIIGNSSAFLGGGIYCDYEAAPTIASNTFFGNSVTTGSFGEGGAICCHGASAPILANCILWGNSAAIGKEISVGEETDPSTFKISYSDVEGGQASAFVDTNCDLSWGAGMIDEDPLFVTGPLGDYYLSHVECGHSETSPCVDAGDPASAVFGTTNCLIDEAPLDMGYHGRLASLVAGPGPGEQNQPLVRTFAPVQDAAWEYEFSAYGAPQYGVNVSSGDVDGDGQAEILTGAGPGAIYGPHVRGFQVDGTPLSGLSFLAYGTNRWGVNVAAGNIDGDIFDEIITGAGPGEVFGPHVRAFDYDGSPGVIPVPGVSFFAYGTPKWGVNVAAGDIDGDGFDEIVTGAGPGTVYGPHVRGWNVDGGSASPMAEVSFIAYGTHQYGVNVTCGDVDGDGVDEIITGPGPGSLFGAHVRGWNYDGDEVVALPGFSFFAWNDVQYGAKVFAGADLDGDGRDELVVGGGPDPAAGTPVKVYVYDEGQATEWFSLEAFMDLDFTHGTSVSAGLF